MGYEGFKKNINIKKVGNEVMWFGEKNLILYDREFETHLNEATQNFYRKKADQWSTDLSSHEYILKVSTHLKKEEDNCDFMMQQETKEKIIKIVLRETIEKKAEAVTEMENTGCKFMFNERKVEQLTRMFKVFSRVESTLSFIINQMNPYVMQEGGKIVLNEETKKDPIKFTELLLNLKLQMDELIEVAFDNHIRFQKSRD